MSDEKGKWLYPRRKAGYLKDSHLEEKDVLFQDPKTPSGRYSLIRVSGLRCRVQRYRDGDPEGPARILWLPEIAALLGWGCSELKALLDKELEEG